MLRPTTPTTHTLVPTCALPPVSCVPMRIAALTLALALCKRHLIWSVGWAVDRLIELIAKEAALEDTPSTSVLAAITTLVQMPDKSADDIRRIWAEGS